MVGCFKKLVSSHSTRARQYIHAYLVSGLAHKWVRVLNDKQPAVFRVRQLGLARVAAADWGSFYSGDCYLVHDGRHGGSHIHYWIGGGYISETNKYFSTHV